jgi:hypothetical protein
MIKTRMMVWVEQLQKLKNVGSTCEVCPGSLKGSHYFGVIEIDGTVI